ncbi:hypothetical protein RHGRI_016904 [Rhododendron griersonianum]|uniref:MADS-box domain-containing protein n=1 Tax=Rhododendron griersonianum TaxID=479676 RepID=A0AAV6JWA5_9ERIC|nr:hypothetical protein RHGRI_016904 [Rhododendron griersonianum]
MGRVKLKMKRIENNTNRQVTYSKRRNGLIKKAYEISVLCDIDLALIMFSPSGRLTHFSSKTRIEDVFHRFINLSDQERVSAISSPSRDRGDSSDTLVIGECLIRTLNQLKTENEVACLQHTKTKVKEVFIDRAQAALFADRAQAKPPSSSSTTSLELVQEIGWLNQQLETAEEQLSMFEPDTSSMNSLEELESCQKQIEDILSTVTERKECLLNNYASSSHTPSCLQEMQQQQQMPTYFENNPQMFESSVPFIPLREIPSAVYDPMLQGTSSNMDLQGMGECQLFSPIQVSSFLSGRYFHPTTYALFVYFVQKGSIIFPQQGMEEPGVAAFMPHDLGEYASSTSGEKSDSKASNYEGELGYKLPSPQD